MESEPLRSVFQTLACLYLIFLVGLGGCGASSSNTVANTTAAGVAKTREVELEGATAGDLHAILRPDDVTSLVVLDSPRLKDGDWISAIANMKQLDKLILVRCELDDDAVLSLTRSRVCPKTLNLSGNRLTDAVLPAIAGITSLRRLFIGNSVVDVTGNSGITSHGLGPLKSLQLEYLSLNGLSEVDDKAIDILLQLTAVTELDVHRTRLSRNGISRLKERIAVVWNDYTGPS